jgi:predicted transcriptional regulator
MRITVDLPDDLHHRVTSLATHTRRSFSQTAADLMRQGLVASSRSSGSASAVRMDAKTGLPVLYGSRAITPEDVNALEDQS